MNPPIVGGIARVMATQKKCMKKKGFDTASAVRSANTQPISNAAMLHLARLIGRQIAREQFERHVAKDREALRQKSSKST